MANDLQDLMDTLIMPAAMPVLRESCVMPALVFSDFADETRQQNETIRIPKPQDLGIAQDFDPVGGSTSTDLSDDKVDITLTQWKYKQFQMNDQEMRESLTAGILPSAADSAIKEVANAVDLDLLNLYVDIPYFYGVAGTTPSASSDITNTRKLLQKNLAPFGDRRLLLDVEAEASLLDLYSNASTTGSTEALRNASLGRLFQFDTYSDQLIPLHTKGTMAGTPLVNGVVAAGATTLDIDGAVGTETLVKGDLLTFAGVTGQFVVTADIAASGGAFTGVAIYPAVPTGGIADDAAVTLVDNHTPNIAFQKNAFALAMRPLETDAEGSTISIQTDPVSGIPLRLETWRDSAKSTRYWRFDVLYGVKTLIPELAAIMLG